jgi:Predicted membrane protein
MTLKFKARNSKYGNVRFHFSGSNREAYRVLWLAILVNIFTLFLFSPVVIWLYKRYCFNHLSIGQLQFRLGIQWSKFMSAVYIPLCLCLLIGRMDRSNRLLGRFDRYNPVYLRFVLSYLFCLALVWPMISARLYMYTWNHVELGQSYFKTRVTTWRYSWIVLSNWMCVHSVWDS